MSWGSLWRAACWVLGAAVLEVCVALATAWVPVLALALQVVVVSCCAKAAQEACAALQVERLQGATVAANRFQGRQN